MASGGALAPGLAVGLGPLSSATVKIRRAMSNATMVATIAFFVFVNAIQFLVQLLSENLASTDGCQGLHTRSWPRPVTVCASTCVGNRRCFSPSPQPFLTPAMGRHSLPL